MSTHVTIHPDPASTPTVRIPTGSDTGALQVRFEDPAGEGAFVWLDDGQARELHAALGAALAERDARPGTSFRTSG